MSKRIAGVLIASAGVLGSLALSAPALAQTEERAAEPEAIVVTGTRALNRTRLDTTAPVDVITSENLGQIGTTELNQALSVALPSFNFQRPASLPTARTQCVPPRSGAWRRTRPWCS